MKQLLLVFISFLIPLLTYSQIYFEEIPNPSLPKITNGAIATADLDNDDDLDLFITGADADGIVMAKIFINDGTGVFVEDTSSAFEGVESSAVGIEHLGSTSTSPQRLDIIYSGRNQDGSKVTKIYYSNAFDSGYTEGTIEPSANSLNPFSDGTIGFINIDKDNTGADLGIDLLMSGDSDLGPYTAIFKKNENGQFVSNSPIDFTDVRDSALELYDYDNDGDLDLLMTGWAFQGFPVTLLYTNQNLGDIAANFTLSDINNNDFEGLYDSSVAFADFNNDGLADIITSGTNKDDVAKTNLYFRSTVTGNFELSNNNLIGVSDCNVAASDIDNDGDQDILITGLDNNFEPITKLYLNNGNEPNEEPTFTETECTIFEGIYLSTIKDIFVDIDNDGDDDVIIIGETVGEDSDDDDALPTLISKIYRNEGTISPSEHPDYNTLADLYNSTQGASWFTNTNWLDQTKPICTWHGITEIDGRVTGIDLSANNLTGEIPTSIGNFQNLSFLDLDFNDLNGTVPNSLSSLTNLSGLGIASNNLSGSIPDFTNQNLNYLKIDNNNFQFSDISDEFETYLINIPDFSYSPQYTEDAPEETNIAIGDDIILTLTDIDASSKNTSAKKSLAENAYQWFKDDLALTVDANSNSYTITNAQASDSGIYHCEITNTDISGMTIKRQPISLNIGALNIEEAEIQNVQIYANPTTDFLNIKLTNIEATSGTIFDISGRKVLSLKLLTNVTVVDVSNLTSGVYLLKINSPHKTINKRIIKQ